MTVLEPPQTSVAHEVAELLDQHPLVVRRHSERSYQFAAGFARADGVELDEEVLYLGTVLHDVGLSPAGEGTPRFDVRGANLIRDLLLDHGFEADRVANVWDCIAMHASSELARHKSPETRYANRGISLDLRGAGGEALEPEFVRAVLDRWPRDDFPTGFSEALMDEARNHLDSVRTSWMESVAAAAVPGFKPTDLIAAIHASADFR